MVAIDRSTQTDFDKRKEEFDFVLSLPSQRRLGRIEEDLDQEFRKFECLGVTGRGRIVGVFSVLFFKPCLTVLTSLCFYSLPSQKTLFKDWLTVPRKTLLFFIYLYFFSSIFGSYTL